MEIAVQLSFYNNIYNFGRSFPSKILRKSSKQEREKKIASPSRHFQSMYSFRQKISTNLSAREVIASYCKKCSGDEVIQFEKKWKMKHLKLR